MRLEVRPFQFSDLSGLGMSWDKPAALKAVIFSSAKGTRNSAYLDGACVGCGGVADVAGEWTAWVDVTPKLKAYGIAFTKLARRLLKEFQDAYEWELIYATCLPENKRWAEHFGFKPTGVVIGDRLRMVLVKE